MSEERLQAVEALSNENNQNIKGINAALREITETMKAFASGIVELREQQAQQQQQISFIVASQQNLIEAQRTLFDTVERLSNTVERLASTVENNDVKHTQDMATLTAAVERLDRIVDYFIRRDPDK